MLLLGVNQSGGYSFRTKGIRRMASGKVSTGKHYAQGQVLSILCFVAVVLHYIGILRIPLCQIAEPSSLLIELSREKSPECPK